MRNPSFLCLDRHGGFLFRRAIPKSFRPYFQNRRDIRKSLGTYHRPTAIKRARHCASSVDRVFDQLTIILRSKYEKEQELSEIEIECIHHLVDRVIDYIGEDPHLKNEDGEAQALLTMAAEELCKIDSLRDKFDLASMKLKLLEEMRERQLRNQAAELLEQDLQLPTGTLIQQPTSTSAAKPPTTGLKLSECWAKYRQEKITTGDWKSPGTISENDEASRALLDIVSDIPANQFTKPQAVAFKEGMLDYPRNRFRGANATLPLNTARERIPQRLALATLSNRMTMMATFLEWSAAHGHMTDNPLTTRIIPARDIDQEEREQFSEADLELIFHDKIFSAHKYRQDWQYWLPLLGLFTGARLEELCQLRPCDTQQSEFGHYICIGERPDFKIKTKNAVRRIPIHKAIVDCGFLALVTKREEQHGNNGPLFTLTATGGKLGKEPSKWFGRLKTKLGLGPSKTFHSFRHTFNSALINGGVQDSHARALMGHAQDGETFRRYWHKNQSSFFTDINLLPFGDLIVHVKSWPPSSAKEILAPAKSISLKTLALQDQDDT